MMEKVWRELARRAVQLAVWCWRRSKAKTGIPCGIPGHRDPDAPCPGYEPRPREMGDWGDCRGDGHYLCEECCHRYVFDPDDDEEF